VREGDTVSTSRPLKINNLQLSSFALCNRDVSQFNRNCPTKSSINASLSCCPRGLKPNRWKLLFLGKPSNEMLDVKIPGLRHASEPCNPWKTGIYFCDMINH
jgi:hypothetical protein